MATGRIANFNASRGYGFIARDDGGEDVFVHADELAEAGVTGRTGVRVEFDIIDGQRGPKAYGVQPWAEHLAAAGNVSAAAEAGDPGDADLCDTIPFSVYASEITDALISVAPAMTAGQIVEVRNRMVARARTRGWLLD